MKKLDALYKKMADIKEKLLKSRSEPDKETKSYLDSFTPETKHPAEPTAGMPKGTKRGEKVTSTGFKLKLIKALADSGFHPSALLLKNWNEYDENALLLKAELEMQDTDKLSKSEDDNSRLFQENKKNKPKPKKEFRGGAQSKNLINSKASQDKKSIEAGFKDKSDFSPKQLDIITEQHKNNKDTRNKEGGGIELRSKQDYKNDNIKAEDTQKRLNAIHKNKAMFESKHKAKKAGKSWNNAEFEYKYAKDNGKPAPQSSKANNIAIGAPKPVAAPTKLQPAPTSADNIQSKVVRRKAPITDKNLKKSNYGPKDLSLYNTADNAKRKATNTNSELKDIGKNKNVKMYTTANADSQSSREASQQKKYNKIQSDKSSVKTMSSFSPEAIKAMEDKANKT